MKYGLLVTSPVSEHKNIGDYIQSLAALQFTPEVHSYVEKENASGELAINDDIKTIMNAWYMWQPENWPPNKKIIPLLTSMHLSPLTAEKMIEGEKTNYFVENGPVGCRDVGTLQFLQSKDIPSYFSGCLTLTLGKKYKSNEKVKDVIFVDPYISPLRDKVDGKFVYYYSNVLRFIKYFLKSPFTILQLSKKSYFHARLPFMKYYNATMFYNAYRTKFSKETILNAKYFSHIVPVEVGETQEELLERSEKLVEIYAKASLVVTSRIHCALPCLGLETPIVFVMDDKMNSKKNLFNAPGRFDGILNFFRVMTYTTSGLSSSDEVLGHLNKLDCDTKFSNKDEYTTYRDALMEQCETFMR